MRDIKESAQPTSSDKREDFVSAPTISLPKGGGVLRGIGEKFAANPVTGSGSLSVPIATSPGRSRRSSTTIKAIASTFPRMPVNGAA